MVYLLFFTSLPLSLARDSLSSEYCVKPVIIANWSGSIHVIFISDTKMAPTKKIFTKTSSCSHYSPSPWGHSLLFLPFALLLKRIFNEKYFTYANFTYFWQDPPRFSLSLDQKHHPPRLSWHPPRHWGWGWPPVCTDKNIFFKKNILWLQRLFYLDLPCLCTFHGHLLPLFLTWNIFQVFLFPFVWPLTVWVAPIGKISRLSQF